MNDYNELKRVYALLADDLSKKIYLDRLIYSITGDMDCLFEMLKRTYNETEAMRYNSNYELLEFCEKIKKSVGDKKLIVFGAGNVGTLVIQLIHEYGFTKDSKIQCMFCDNNPALQNKIREHHNPHMRLPVISPDKLLEDVDNEFIVIATISRKAALEIHKQCMELGIKEDRILRPTDTFEYMVGDIYFENSIMHADQHEIFCDIGAYDMYNTSQFIRWCPDYDKVYAFEADPVSYQKCKQVVEASNMQRIELVNNGIWSEETEISFWSAPDGEYGGSRIDNRGKTKVKAVSLDSYLQGNRVTFIKMDIEGAELEALKGAQNTIRNFKPKLALSIYHKPWDMVILASYISSINPDYKFFIRHHTCGIWDTVLYAV